MMRFSHFIYSFLLALPFFAFAKQPDLILAKHYTNQPISGWAMSEKLDGVRAYWNGKQLISRQGYAFTPPPSYLKHFPPFPLDGELFTKRGDFEQLSAIVRSSNGNWQQVHYHVFDVPSATGNLYQRLRRLKDWLAAHPQAPIRIIKQIPVKNAAHANTFLAEVEKQGGEGVMLRNPEPPYHGGRSNNLLKMKSAHDEECTVTRHHEGKGKYQGKLGAISCRNQRGEFRIGSGFKDHDRNNPPPVGSTITYRYRGFTKSGKPRFATFVRIRQN